MTATNIMLQKNNKSNDENESGLGRGGDGGRGALWGRRSLRDGPDRGWNESGAAPCWEHKGPNAGKGLDLKEAHETGALRAGLEEEEMGLERPRQAASSQPGKR